MTKHLSSLTVLSLFPLFLHAVALPQASLKPELNLQHYLEYTFDETITLTCKEKSKLFICESRNQKIQERDENNVSSDLAFKKLQFHFNVSLASSLKKKPFHQTMKEIQESNTALEKQNASQNGLPIPISGPLEDTLNRSLFENLKHITLDNLDIKNSDPKTHITVKNITYDNSMIKTAKSVNFDERIFGKLQLRYTQALMNTNDSVSLHQSLPSLLETWFDTNNETRAKYVGDKLQKLYAKEAILPINGEFSISTKYLQNDKIALNIDTKNQTKDASGSFTFDGELHNASTTFKPANKAQTAGMPDFLFKSIQLHSFNKADNYRHLIKKDKKFAHYIGEYHTLIQSHFDKEIKTFTNNAVISNWFKQAKIAFSKIIQGEAETLDISIVNKNGATAMQFFGILMGKMMQAPPQQGATTPTQEAVIADIATEHLELKIEAR